MQLTTENVSRIFRNCLFRQDELRDLQPGQIPPGAVLAHGIRLKVGFHSGRLEQYQDEIQKLLEELPDDFQSWAPGGSFLAAHKDKHGNYWGEHPNIEELYILGLAAGLIENILPREEWHLLTGSLPMFRVKVPQ